MMNIYNYRWLAGLYFLLAMGLPCQAQENDSIPVSTTDLNELVVTAKRGWIEDDKIVFIPSKTEQKLSNSPETLIKSMNLPILIVKDNTITTLSGDPVSIFINGTPATPSDIATFWPKEAKRVEYLSNPSDAKFRGARNVVNFIMQEYKVGGVSKASLFQMIPNTTIPSIASKLAYKNLTLGISANMSYRNSTRQSAEMISDYSDLYFNGDYYEHITKTEKTAYKSKSLSPNVAFDTRLKLHKFEMTHTLSWGWSKTSDSSHGEAQWSPSLFSSESQWTVGNDRTNNISVLGGYTYTFNSKWILTGVWSYAHAHNNHFSQFRTADQPIISNNAKENSDAFNIRIFPTFYCSPKSIFQLKLESNTSWYKTVYEGSADTLLHQMRNESSAEVIWQWIPNNAIMLYVRPGVNMYHTEDGHITNSSVRPTCSATLNWNISNKLTLGSDLTYFSSDYPISYSSPVSIRTSELIWTQGNPDLKQRFCWMGTLRGTYLPFNWFTLGATVSYFRTHNDVGYIYESAPQNMEGLIMKNITFRPKEDLYVILNLRFSAFERKLNLSLYPTFSHTVEHTFYKRHLNDFKVGTRIDYTYGNCRFGIECQTGEKSMSNGGQLRTKMTQPQLGFNFTWGTGNFYLNVDASDLLYDKRKTIETFISNAFHSQGTSFKTGRVLILSLSYTLGYGKKLDKNIDINSGPSIPSSILNTK